MKRKYIPMYNQKELKRQEIIAERKLNIALKEAALKAAEEKEEREKVEEPKSE